MALEAIMLDPDFAVRKSFPMEWFEGRLTKRSVVAAEAPKTPDAIAELAYKADKLDPSLVRESMLELALKHQHSAPKVENLKAELSVSFAINRGFRQQLEAEMEANGRLSAELKHEIAENKRLNAEIEKLNAAIKHECKDNEKLNATLMYEREENESLNAALKFTLRENTNLIELTRSLREQADGLDGLRAVLEIIADEINAKKGRRTNQRKQKGKQAQAQEPTPPSFLPILGEGRMGPSQVG